MNRRSVFPLLLLLGGLLAVPAPPAAWPGCAMIALLATHHWRTRPQETA